MQSEQGRSKRPPITIATESDIMSKHIIYQLFPRTFTNYCETRKPNGSIEENGCGKLNQITEKALQEIKSLGATHVWYTGVIEHATQTDRSAMGIPADNPLIVKGKAGSPYAIKDYYDIDPDLAEDIPNRMQEFEALVERTHKAGMGVVLDFVPNHVARQYKSDQKPAGVKDFGEDDNPTWAFSPKNNFYYIPGQRFNVPNIKSDVPLDDSRRQALTYEEYPAKATGNDCFNASPTKDDWYETVKLNYGVYYHGGMEKQFDPMPDTWLKMRDILLFWCKKGVDAFRCDMAHMVPVEFWGWVTKEVRKQYPNAEFIAEIYDPSLYRSYLYEGGFDYLYDKVGMYDYLRGVTSKDWEAQGITSQWQAVEDIRSRMLYFLENHDEQRIASGFFCGRGASAEPAMTVAACLGNNPILIYAGQELGERGMDKEGYSGIDGRTTIFDYWGVSSLQAWANKGKFDGRHLSNEQKELRSWYKRLLNLTQSEAALREGLMFDLMYVQDAEFNRKKHYVFMRKYKDETLLIAVNFDAREEKIKIVIPPAAFAYLELEEKASVSMKDLLTGKEYSNIPLCTDKAIELNVGAWKGMILKVNS